VYYFCRVQRQNTLNEILDEKNKVNILSNEEKNRIRHSVILELYDKNPKNWLFGESFN
jgi:hypothetical protein